MATAGALTGLTGGTTEEESVPVEYGVFQNTAVQNPDSDLMNYGTAAVPTLTWVTQIQTGERSFDPSSQFDNSMLEEYQKLVDSQGQPTGMMGPGQISKQVTGDIVSQVGQTVGASAGAALVDPYMSGDAGAKILAGAQGKRREQSKSWKKWRGDLARRAPWKPEAADRFARSVVPLYRFRDMEVKKR